MIYSESKKFLFCHVPKTGGTSITSLFSDYTSPFQQSNFSKICRRIPFAEKTYKFYDFLNRPHTTCYKAKTLFGKKFYSIQYTVTENNKHQRGLILKKVSYDLRKASCLLVSKR